MPVPITPKPTTPHLILSDELYTNLRACVLLTEASGDPVELVTGHAAVWPGEGGHVGHGTISTGPWGKQRAFLAGDSSVNWGAGSGIPTATTGKASCGVVFHVPATTAFTDVFFSLAGSNTISIGGILSGGAFFGYALYGGGNNHNVQMNFTLGHDYGVVLVVDGSTSPGSGMPGTLYWLDYTDQTAGIQSHALASGDTRTLADFVPGANADAFALNSTAYNGTNNVGFPIVAAAMWNGALTAQMVADYFADPSRMARVALTATPPSVGAGGSSTVRIGANAPVLGANSGAAVAISLASSGQSTPGGKTGQTWVDASDIDVAITDGSTGTLIFSEPNYGASVNVTVSSSPATGYSITPATTTPVVGSAFNVTLALTGGATSSNTTIALTTTDGLGSFSSSPVVLNTGVPSITVTYTAGTAGAATLTATATVNPGSYASPQTASVNATASGLQPPVVTLVKAGWTSNDVSIAQPAGGSGGIARIELHRLPRYETTPSGATLIHTFTAPTFPIAYTITGLTANTPAIFTYVAVDGGGQSAATTPRGTYGWEFPTPKIHLWVIGQSHMANMPSMAQMFDVGETDGGTTSPNVVPQPTGDGVMFRMTQTNSGAGATGTADWLPTAPVGYLTAGHAAAVTAAAAAGATEVWMIAEFGHNDINDANPPVDIAANLTTIFDWVRSNPVVAGAPHYFLVLAPIPAPLDFSFTSAMLSTVLIEIRAALKGLDNGTDVFYFGDDMLGLGMSHHEFYENTFYQHLTVQPGGYSQSGYQVLAGLIADGLKRVRLRKAGLITDVGGISPPPPPPPPPPSPAPPVGIDWTKTSDI